jgi:hypothetical protein
LRPRLCGNKTPVIYFFASIAKPDAIKYNNKYNKKPAEYQSGNYRFSVLSAETARILYYCPRRLYQAAEWSFICADLSGLPIPVTTQTKQ